MKKKRLSIFLSAILTVGTIFFTAISPAAASLQHTVVSGDSMWKIAVKYQMGLSEIIAANPNIVNPALIYPGQVLNIPGEDQSVRAFELKVIELTNQKRVQSGLKPLTENWELSRVARYKSQDMHDNRYFSHNSPVYGSPFTMMKNFGLSYRTAGENIAMGQRTPEQVVEAWWNSPGHKANILNSSYTQIGVGYVASGNYWTQQFIG